VVIAMKTGEDTTCTFKDANYFSEWKNPDGNPLPAAPRTRVCEGAAEAHGFRAYHDGSWYRCCGGHIRRLTDCCGYVRRRINGDAALTGYCYHGRRVFCVMYYDTKVKC